MKARSVMLVAALTLGPMDGLSGAAQAQTKPPANRPLLNSLQELFDALGQCWVPPPLEKSRPGTQITVRITFSRSGEVMGEPRFTYITPGIPPEMRTAYQLSVADAISRCAPMPLTPGLAGAIAGRPVNMRYDDTRGQKGADRSWPTITTG
jgi:hypothetical protein